jgi:cytochrome c oxidase subunit I+III
VSGIAFIAAVLYWLWTGTAEIPEKEEKDIGRGISLPIYTSGVKSVGWWAMFITMTGDGTAFASLIFGYFFFWTIHSDFTGGAGGPGVLWPMVALACFAVAWTSTVGAQETNRRGKIAVARVLLGVGALVSVAGCLAALAGPWTSGLDPTSHAYPAIVWILVIWTCVHGALGVIMQTYCLARSLAGRLTPRHDMDLHNVTLYWHFMLVTALVTFGVVGLFPEAL